MENQNPFKPSVKVSWKQIFLIILILVLVFCIPFVIQYIRNPDQSVIKNVVTTVTSKINLKSSDLDTSPSIIEIPLIHKQIDVSVVKENPYLIVYVGLGLVVVAIIMGIGIMRNLLRR